MNPDLSYLLHYLIPTYEHIFVWFSAQRLTVILTKHKCLDFGCRGPDQHPTLQILVLLLALVLREGRPAPTALTRRTTGPATSLRIKNTVRVVIFFLSVAR